MSTTLCRIVSYSVCFVLSCGVARGQSLIHVDVDAPGNGDGTSWYDAYPDLRDGLTVAGAGDWVLVAQGFYLPAGPDGDREISFELKSGVSFLGGTCRVWR